MTETPKDKAATPAAAPAPAAEAEAHTAGESTSAAATKAKLAAEKAKKALGSLKALSNLKNLHPLANSKELIADLADKDRRTRRMARYFVASVAGIVIVIVLIGLHVSQLRIEKKLNTLTDTGEQGKNLGDFLKRQAEEAKRKFSTQSLGSFTIELKSQDDKDHKRPRGVMDLAEVEIVVQCDEKETCDFIEESMTAVRNELTGIFTPMDREELMSREGKRKLKMRIMGKLNYWLPKGKITDLYFNKLVIS